MSSKACATRLKPPESWRPERTEVKWSQETAEGGGQAGKAHYFLIPNNNFIKNHYEKLIKENL